MDDLRIAAVVMRSVLGETQDNLNRMKAWVGEAASDGADLVCFPELNLTGYSVREIIHSEAEPIPGPLSRPAAGQYDSCHNSAGRASDTRVFGRPAVR